MFKRIRNVLLRRSLESAVQATAEAAATVTAKTFRQVFNVQAPITVYVRASYSDVTLRKRPGNQVELLANLQASFGWEFVAEQDEAGVYIVARRKPVVGALSQASFTLFVPPEANLVFHLTPGSVHLYDIEGKISLPAEQRSS
jgi:hypothetical protein